MSYMLRQAKCIVSRYRIEGGAFDGVMDAKTPFMYKVRYSRTARVDGKTTTAASYIV
jgi:hypothetical protein